MLTKKIVKYIQSLSHKKFRDEDGVFIAEGPKVVSELILSKKFVIRYICGDQNWMLENQHLVKNLSSDSLFEADEEMLSRISQLKTPNKVLGIFEKKDNADLPNVHHQISIMLDDIQDPGNMGTIIRNADWFGVENIICSNNCVDCYNPKVVQATMGSLARVAIHYVDLATFITSNPTIPVFAAALSGKSIYEAEPIQEGILLIGNESKGVHPELMKKVQHKITIPRYGHAESLNAAVATGILLAHIKKGA